MNTFKKATEIFQNTTKNFLDFVNVSKDENFIGFTSTWDSNPMLSMKTFELLSELFETDSFNADEIVDRGNFFDLDFFFYDVPQEIVDDFVESHYQSLANPLD